MKKLILRELVLYHTPTRLTTFLDQLVEIRGVPRRRKCSSYHLVPATIGKLSDRFLAPRLRICLYKRMVEAHRRGGELGRVGRIRRQIVNSTRQIAWGAVDVRIVG